MAGMIVPFGKKMIKIIFADLKKPEAEERPVVPPSTKVTDLSMLDCDSTPKFGLRQKVKSAITKAKAGMHVGNKLRRKKFGDKTTNPKPDKDFFFVDPLSVSSDDVGLQVNKRDGRVFLPNLALDNDASWDEVFDVNLEDARSSPSVEDEAFFFENFDGTHYVPACERLSTILEEQSNYSTNSLATVIHHPVRAADPQQDPESDSDYEAESTTSFVDHDRHTTAEARPRSCEADTSTSIELQEVQRISALPIAPALTMSPIMTISDRNEEFSFAPKKETLSLSKVAVVHEANDPIPITAIPEPTLTMSSIIIILESNNEIRLIPEQKEAPITEKRTLALSTVVSILDYIGETLNLGNVVDNYANNNNNKAVDDDAAPPIAQQQKLAVIYTARIKLKEAVPLPTTKNIEVPKTPTKEVAQTKVVRLEEMESSPVSSPVTKALEDMSFIEASETVTTETGKSPETPPNRKSPSDSPSSIDQHKSITPIQLPKLDLGFTHTTPEQQKLEESSSSSAGSSPIVLSPLSARKGSPPKTLSSGTKETSDGDAHRPYIFTGGRKIAPMKQKKSSNSGPKDTPAENIPDVSDVKETLDDDTKRLYVFVGDRKIAPMREKRSNYGGTKDTPAENVRDVAGKSLHELLKQDCVFGGPTKFTGGGAGDASDSADESVEQPTQKRRDVLERGFPSELPKVASGPLFASGIEAFLDKRIRGVAPAPTTGGGEDQTAISSALGGMVIGDVTTTIPEEYETEEVDKLLGEEHPDMVDESKDDPSLENEQDEANAADEEEEHVTAWVLPARTVGGQRRAPPKKGRKPLPKAAPRR